MDFKSSTGKTIAEAFVEFHNKNPHVYKVFENQALLAISAGRKKISAKLIINWIRWNSFITTSDIHYKINDAFQAYYARLFVIKFPQYIDIFNFRKLRSDETPDVGL